MAAKDWQVGQKVLGVYINRMTSAASFEERTVTKVGRKWVQMEHGRFNPEDCSADGTWLHYIFRDVAHFESWKLEREQRRQEAENWRHVHTMICRMYTRPDYITREKIAQIAELVGVVLPNKTTP
jgi:histone acetyltransferase (RNA polymerase elongator complex component)